MPRTIPRKKPATTRVEVATHKQCGDRIKCLVCHYEGPADVIVIRKKYYKKKHEPRGMERCPQCKSLNIKPLEDDEDMEKDNEITWEMDEWAGCYPSDWRKKLVPGAMAHPAKFSSRLIRKIYEHLFEMEWVQDGDSILDPFGGVALGALNAMEMGLRWTGVELEPKFAELGEHNIDNWNIKFRNMPRWSGGAVLLQGDSRRLLEVISGQGIVDSGQDGVVSSPPFENKLSADYLDADARRAYAREKGISNAEHISPIDMEAIGGREQKDARYGFTEGQLGAMKADGFDSAVSSPPFRQSEGGTPEPKPGGTIDNALYARHAAGNSKADGYGATEGQLANMREGDYDSAVSSPPYEKTEIAIASDKELMGENRKKLRDAGNWDGYGDTPGQLGAESADDFWMAARVIVEQVYQALKPGGHATWVCKDFVRGGERVPFSDQWRQLCEAVGFVTVHEHHALLTSSGPTKLTLEGDTIRDSKSYKSFFRRLAENKGSPRIDWETVWCMEKPHE